MFAEFQGAGVVEKIKTEYSVFLRITAVDFIYLVLLCVPFENLRIEYFFINLARFDM